MHEWDMASQEKLINLASLPRPVAIRMPRLNLRVERGRIDYGSDQEMIACLKRSQAWF